MTIHVGASGPPHRDSVVAEFHVRRDGTMDIPAEIYRSEGRLMIALFAKEGGISWEFPLADFVEAIGRGIAVLGA